MGGYVFCFWSRDCRELGMKCTKKCRKTEEEYVTSVSGPPSYTISPTPRTVAFRVCIVMAFLLLARGIAGAGAAAMLFVLGLWM